MDELETNDHPRHQGHLGRWVVGVDGSESSRHAASWAVENASGRASEVRLVTTWSVPVATSASPMGPVLTGATCDALEGSAQAIVDDLARVLASTLDVPVTRSVGQGGAASLLLDAARHSALLVVGSRGRGGFTRLLLGSTSTQCATHSTAPVAVIPATADIRPIMSIVVAFDGSKNSIAALEWANHFAAPGSTIECVSVWDTAPITVGADLFFFPEASELAEDRFAHLVTQTIRPIARSDIEVHHTFVDGQPRAILAEFAASSDLLVVGTRGHGALGAAILGSVSTWLLHHATQPMVVVPEGPDDRAGADDVATEGRDQED